VDNASGVISVLLAARALSALPDVGVIITSAEELGLAGARAFVDSHSTRDVALNCDTIDDAGEFRCMASGARGSLVAAIGRAASRLSLNVPIRALLPGILADSVAFADAGWESVTLSRGNLATLARVHTSSDTRERLNGTGIAKAALLLAATVEELT
jgi:Zn-dependent M28 family amino/carboxypeptidase